MKIIRIFPRKTNATPDDANAVINRIPQLFDEADQVHISVAFTYDMERAEYLYSQWKYVAPTLIGGPATGQPSGNFIPGMYLKQGYTITSRGCSNKCWFCSVWKREPKPIELPVMDGWNIMDDNLLQCSEDHIQKVFAMLKRQKHKPRFTGGLEAKLITPERALQLKELKPDYLYFAYDTPDDLEPLINAGKILNNAGVGIGSHVLMCYVLIGYPNDTFESALYRIKQTISAGFMPFAMLWRNEKGEYKKEWKQFQRQWANPIITAQNSKKIMQVAL